MRLVTTFEHGWLSIGNEGRLSVAEADALSIAEDVLPKGCLEWGRRRVKFKQYCGVVQIRRLLQIEILPKVFPHQTPEQQRKTLIDMLDTTGHLEGLSPQAAGLGISHHRLLLDVFIGHFLKLLEVQLQQGMLRDYLEVEDTLDRVRGRIDLVRQHRENLFKPHRLACRFSELAVDIPINRLLHTALVHISNLAVSPVLRQQIQSMRMRFSGVDVIRKGARLPHVDDLNRMQRRYADVVKLARLFLDGQYLDVRTGEQQVHSLLFDMNQLFERFVAIKMRPVARRDKLSLIEQGPQKYLGVDRLGKGRLLMRPDITLVDKMGRPLIIMDAKWKLLDSDNPLASLSSADLYQLSTYASAYRCDQVVLLYPEQSGLQGEHRLTLNLANKVTLTVAAVPLESGRYDLDRLMIEKAA